MTLTSSASGYPVPPEGETRLPDLLDCLLVWTVAEYESGRVAPIDHEEIQEMCSVWSDGFVLDDELLFALSHHRAGDLEWVELVIEGLWGCAGRDDDQAWSTELLTQVGHIVGTRIPELETWKLAWARGVQPSRDEISGLLRSGFPSLFHDAG